MEREHMGDVDTAQASDTEPEPRWGGWANVRKSIGLGCIAPEERPAWASGEGYFEGEVDI